MTRAQGVEVRTPVLEPAHRLAVKDDTLDRKSRHRGADRWEVRGPISPSARPQVHHAALAPGDEAVAVPFELVNPFGAGRDLMNQERLTGTNEARGWRRSRARMVRQVTQDLWLMRSRTASAAVEEGADRAHAGPHEAKSTHQCISLLSI
jgi:hypothetical protein